MVRFDVAFSESASQFPVLFASNDFNFINSFAISTEVTDLDLYDGPKDITPHAYSDIVLNTAIKKVDGDITVRKIPAYETSNEFGKTFFIG